MNVCLRVQPEEKVCVITDEATLEIAAAIVEELEKLGSPHRVWVLEDLAERPLKDLPPEILADLETSQVSIFAVWAQSERTALAHADDGCGESEQDPARAHGEHQPADHAGRHAGGFSESGPAERESDRHGAQGTAGAGDHGGGNGPDGGFESELPWLKTSGIITPEKWGNLPGGEIFTTPGEVNGTFVIDGVVGDYLCTKFGNLQGTPLTIHMKKNRLTEAHSENRELEDDFWKYTHTDENSDRVGEFAIGTNIDLKEVIGQILQDEKYPGVHIAFGNPYGAHTGAEWDSSTHIDVVGRKFNIWVDDEQIMQDGKFLVEA